MSESSKILIGSFIPLIIYCAFLKPSSAQTNHLEGVSINVCGDGAEWPPFIYWKRDKNGEKTDQIEGYTVDLLTRVLNESNIKTKFFLPPWKRCLQKSVDNSQYTIALDASYSKEEKNNIF